MENYALLKKGIGNERIYIKMDNIINIYFIVALLYNASIFIKTKSIVDIDIPLA